MKRSLKSVILLCLLAACIGGYMLVTHLSEQAAEVSVESKETVVLNARAAEELTALSWTAEDGSIRFTKDDAGWHYDADSAFPANETTLNSMADSLISLTAERSISDVTDLSYYGLAEPSFAVTAEWSDGSTVQYSQGDITAFADGYYVSMSGDSTVYIVSDPLDTVFGKTLNSLAVMETIPAAENVTRITMAGLDAVYEEVSRTINTDQHWYTADGTALDNTAVESLISEIRAVGWEELVTASASEDDLSNMMLADNAETVSLYSGDTAVLTLLIGTANDNGSFYARLPGSGIVYTIAADSLSEVMAATAAGLSAEDSLLTLPYDDVQAARLTAGGTVYDLQTIDQRPAADEAESTETDGSEALSDPTEDDETVWKQLLTVTATGSAAEKEGAEVLLISVTNKHGISAELSVREYDADSYQASLNGGASYTVSADKIDKLIRMLKQLK